MLKLRNVASGYGLSQVLFDISLEVGEGEVHAVLGRNGMGKTTLVRTLFGQFAVADWLGAFSGQDISGWAGDRIARLGVAIVPEGRQCFPNLTVLEHLTAFADQRNPGMHAGWNQPGF